MLAQYTIGPVPVVDGSFAYLRQQHTDMATTSTRKISDPLATAAIIFPPPSIISSSCEVSKVAFGAVKAELGRVSVNQNRGIVRVGEYPSLPD